MADNNATLDERKQELADIDSRIATLKFNVQLGEDLESLHEDERFKRVMIEGYFDAEAERIFGVLTDPTHHLKRDVMENLMEKLTSTRNIKQYYGVLMQNADMAPEEIANEEAYRLEVTSRETIIDAELA